MLVKRDEKVIFPFYFLLEERLQSFLRHIGSYFLLRERSPIMLNCGHHHALRFVVNLHYFSGVFLWNAISAYLYLNRLLDGLDLCVGLLLRPVVLLLLSLVLNVDQLFAYRKPECEVDLGHLCLYPVLVFVYFFIRVVFRVYFLGRLV